MKKVLIDLLKKKIDPKVDKVKQLKKIMAPEDNKQGQEKTPEQLKSELKSAENELKTEIDELNKLIVNGDSGFIFQWTKKLDLFAPDGTCELIHYLAQSNILQFVLPSMLDNARKIVDREVGGVHGENIENSRQFILEQIGKKDKGGLPAIQRALVGNSIDSFKYILELKNCKKGIFDVGGDGSNIFHQAILRGVFQELVPYIEGENLNQLARYEGLPEKSIEDHVRSMLISRNSKGYSPAKLSAYVASAPDFQYIFNSGVLQTKSDNTETQIRTSTADGRITSQTVASNQDSLRFDNKNTKIQIKHSNGITPLYQELLEVKLTTQDELLDYLFKHLQDLTNFFVNLLDNQAVEIFDAILKRQKITREYELGKYVISIIHHIRNLDNSTEGDDSNMDNMMEIYRKIFAEYWPEITINDNSLRAYEQLKIIAEAMEDSSSDSVIEIPVDKLKEALDITDEELKKCNGDIVAAAKGKIFNKIAEDYESDHKEKKLIQHKIKLSNSPIMPPSPVKINVKKVVNSVVNKKVVNESQSPLVNDLVEKLVEKVESVIAPDTQDKLETTTDLKMEDIDVSHLNEEASEIEYVEIEISQHIDHIFDYLISKKDLEGNEGLKELYDDFATEEGSEQGINKIGLILGLAAGMSEDSGMFLDFINESIKEKNGKVDNIKEFMNQFIDHISIEKLADYGCVNFEYEIAEIVIQRLHKEGQLTASHLEYAMEDDNQKVLDIAMNTGAINWEDALQVAFNAGNVAFLERCLQENRFSNDNERISGDFVILALNNLIKESSKIYADSSDAKVERDILLNKIGFIEVVLANRSIISEVGNSSADLFLNNLGSTLITFSDKSRKLRPEEYDELINGLKNIERSLKESPLVSTGLSDTSLQSSELSTIGNLTDDFEHMESGIS